MPPFDCIVGKHININRTFTVAGIIAAIIIFMLGPTVSGENKKDVTGMNGYKKAIFAGGCFWCMEPPFEALRGVKKVVAGYTGGHKEDPAYEEVSTGEMGHYESIEVTYDPSIISYSRLLDVFWKQIDPTDPGGQFVDRGPQYRTAIFYTDDEQKELAERSKRALERSDEFDRPIATKIKKSGKFYEAEKYHQDYYKTCPLKYAVYRAGSGRENYIREHEKDGTGPVIRDWNDYKKPSDEELKKKLTPLEYKITQKNGTEQPFHNKYWNNKKEGIYVDIVSGEPLFITTDQYKPGCGWPSFTKPLESSDIVEKKDSSFHMTRTEVRSKHGDSHLGHVFNDSPGPGGLRYCINSASLRFIPKKDLEKEGYGQYLGKFEK